ncbi:MAG: ribosome small subunit-dependent GTPase A [Muribaculaceae bacterium]|nr:ribosome small subunit-dependent GTPase A [Muribaculaceae bacterium]MDE6286017.1 ribosome small subunit-dependent GTPase A [Muribaculaceae bacterium]
MTDTQHTYPLTGRVVRNTGAHYVVETAPGHEINCKVKGNFRIKGLRTTNPVAVGDMVRVGEPGPDGTAYIIDVLDRRNYIVRRSINLSKQSHIIAANVDQAVLVASLAHPTTSTNFIDRFLATAEAYRVHAVLCINKVDLLTEPEDRELLDAVAYLYRSIGYDVVCVSARTGEGLDELRGLLRGKVSLFSGNSGVGKSTLVNDLIPGIEQRTAEISAVHDQGMHTTTFSELFHLPDDPDGCIIDTPGVRGFGTVDFDKADVSHYFPEMFAIGRECRFGNCTHVHEPGCAVRAALDEGRIAQSRYASYLSILDDSADDKYRKPF